MAPYSLLGVLPLNTEITEGYLILEKPKVDISPLTQTINTRQNDLNRYQMLPDIMANVIYQYIYSIGFYPFSFFQGVALSPTITRFAALQKILQNRQGWPIFPLK